MNEQKWQRGSQNDTYSKKQSQATKYIKQTHKERLKINFKSQNN